MRSPLLLAPLALLALALPACSSEAPSTTQPPAAPVFESAGPHPVGNTTFTIDDQARKRTLRVEIWYPADEAARKDAEAGFALETFAPEGKEREQLAALIAAAPDPGTRRRAHSARDAAPAGGAPFPIVAFSHCYDCTRFSTATIAERLASHGIAVVAPDHQGGTLADKQSGADTPLDKAFLEVREGDIAIALDKVLDPSAMELPAPLRGAFDPAKVGVFGHSYGGVTAGLTLMKDTRPKAGLAIAVPMENPLLSGVSMAKIHVPVFFILATEDNSIGTLGNTILRQNYDSANPPVWKAEVTDAGHWSFTDICGIIPDFDAGCTTMDARQTSGEAFTYLDVDKARGIAAAYVTAFFASTLEGDTAAADYLEGSRPSGTVAVKSRH
jgi:predicted dienelactone hydrolase